MPARRERPRIILDWFNVSYRSVVLAGLLAVGALVAGGWYLISYAPSKPRGEALDAIHRAQDKLDEASQYPAAERLDEVRGSARSALAEARDAFERSQWDDARIAAMRAENFAQKAIDMARGEGAVSQEVRIYRIEGDVRVKRAAEFNWEPADRKMTLRVGDQVKTAASGSVQLLYFDGTITTLNPGSLLEIRDVREDPATKVRHVTEKLNWGEVLAETQKRNVDGSFHEVATEKVSTRSDDAGRFRVAADRQSQAASVDVFEGHLQIDAGGRKEQVVSGERVKTDAAGALQAKELLPGVPRLVAPSEGKVFVHEDPANASTGLSWEAVPGAQRYRLVISNKALFASPLYDRDREEKSVTIAGIGAGDYYWKVACVSANGVLGPYSETRHFQVTTQQLRDKRDTTPPILEITDRVQTGPMLILNGRTEPGALLWVDNEKLDVYDDGTFYAVVRLRKEGVNEIQLVSQDAAGNTTKLTDRAYVDPNQ